MNGGQLPTNRLHDINWGVLDHASQCTHVTTMYNTRSTCAPDNTCTYNCYNIINGNNNSCIIPLCIGIVIRDNKIMMRILHAGYSYCNWLQVTENIFVHLHNTSITIGTNDHVFVTLLCMYMYIQIFNASFQGRFLRIPKEKRYDCV